MAESLKEKSFKQNWEQWWKNLRQDYNGTGKNRKQHEFKYFDQLHSFFTNRPVIRPPHIVSSGSWENNTSWEIEDSFVVDDNMPFASEIDQSLKDGGVTQSLSSSSEMVCTYTLLIFIINSVIVAL